MNAGDRGLMAIGWGLTYLGIGLLILGQSVDIGRTGGVALAIIYAVLGLGVVGKLVQLEVRDA